MQQVLIERRDSPRAHWKRDAVIRVGQHERFCKIGNISTQGAFIEMYEQRLEPYMEVALSFLVPGDYKGQEKKTCCVSARVVRLSTDGAGLEFEPLDMESYGAVLGIIYQ